MDLALSTTRSAQDGLGTIDNQGNMDKRECPGWTLRMDSQDGLSGWTSRMDLATWTVDNIRIRQLWTYPRSDTKDQQVLGYQLSAICLYPRSVCRKQIHDFSTVGNVGILSEVYNSRLLESEDPSAKLQQILGESALGSIRGSSIKATVETPSASAGSFAFEYTASGCKGIPLSHVVHLVLYYATLGI
ncbi:hypothetical protein B0O80DRAFT_498160 [Mortierella sp. GBAus27b]|nr:hypothetical protein B0O80DRAFT_498160 [Mortierella sp. GBAus27b]